MKWGIDSMSKYYDKKQLPKGINVLYGINEAGKTYYEKKKLKKMKDKVESLEYNIKELKEGK